MIPLDTLDLATFSALQDKTFQLQTAGGILMLVLEEIRELGHRRPEAARAPFSLGFRGRQGARLPQGTYRLDHATLGTLEIFLAQNGDGPLGSEFEAVFN